MRAAARPQARRYSRVPRVPEQQRQAWAAVDPSAPSGALAAWGPSAGDIYFVGPFGIALGDGSTWGTPYQPNSLSAVSVWGTGVNDLYVVGSDADGMGIYHWF